MYGKGLLAVALVSGLLLLSVPLVPAVHQSRSIVLPSTVDSSVVSVLDGTYAQQGTMNKAEHWAVIVGISDYAAIGDLNYCDDDANDFYNYLTGLGYEHIIVLGDHTNAYVQYDGLATEHNVKDALYTMVTSAGEKDTIAFISSGHGSGDSRGSSLLCMWDITVGEEGEDGYLWDYEVAAILQLAVAENIFVFLDHCFAGGFGDDLLAMPNAAHVYAPVTCDIMGMGWDAGEYSNGLWTYFFLEYTLIDFFGSDPQTEMEVAFSIAESVYPFAGGAHHPQAYDGDPLSPFYLW